MKNRSDRDKTVVTMAKDASDDIWSVDRVSEFVRYGKSNVVLIGSILDDYYEYFAQYLIDYDLDEEFYYSPAAFSEKYYGTPGLDFLVMYFAGIPTVFDFNVPKIKVLPPERLSDLNQLIVAKKDAVANSKSDPPEYPTLSDVSKVTDALASVRSYRVNGK
jgi:hypothetical protein